MTLMVGLLGCDRPAPPPEAARYAPLPPAGPLSDQMGWARYEDGLFAVTEEGIERVTIPTGQARLLVPGAFDRPSSGFMFETLTGSGRRLAVTSSGALRAFDVEGAPIPFPELPIRSGESVRGFTLEGSELFVSLGGTEGGRALAVELESGGIRTVSDGPEPSLGFSIDVHDGTLWGTGCGPVAHVDVAGGVPEPAGPRSWFYCPTYVRASDAGAFFVDFASEVDAVQLRLIEPDGELRVVASRLNGAHSYFAFDGTMVYLERGGELAAVPLAGGRGTRHAPVAEGLRAIAVDPEGVYFADAEGFHALLRSEPAPPRDVPIPAALDAPPVAGDQADGSDHLVPADGRVWWLGGPSNPGLWSAGPDGEPRLEHELAFGHMRLRAAGAMLVWGDMWPAARFSREDGSLSTIPDPVPLPVAAAWTTSGDEVYEMTFAVEDSAEPTAVRRLDLGVLERVPVATFSGLRFEPRTFWAEVQEPVIFFPGMRSSETVWAGNLEAMTAFETVPQLEGRVRVQGSVRLLCGATSSASGLVVLPPGAAARTVVSEVVPCDIATDGRHVFWFTEGRLVAAPLDGSGPRLTLAESVEPLGVAVDERAIYLLEDDLGFHALRVLPRPTP